VTERDVPERKAVKVALREAGLSARQADSLLRGGWSALVGATKAEAEELREALDAMQRRLTR
jgi:hypothetical protein